MSSHRHYYATREEFERGDAVEGWHVVWASGGWSTPLLTRPHAERVLSNSGRLKGKVKPIYLKTIHGQQVRFLDGVVLNERVIRGLRQNEGGLVDGRPPHYSGFAYREGVWYSVEKPWDDARWRLPWECVGILATCFAPSRGANFQAIFEKLRG